MQKTIQLSLLSIAFLSQLQASQDISLVPISITSTAIATDELKSTDAVEVYTKKDIEKAHVQNVYEFLNKKLLYLQQVDMVILFYKKLTCTDMV